MADTWSLTTEIARALTAAHIMQLRCHFLLFPVGISSSPFFAQLVERRDKTLIAVLKMPFTHGKGNISILTKNNLTSTFNLRVFFLNYSLHLVYSIIAIANSGTDT